ncbi:MAG: 4Fe-4S dicluster domain-containing protein [Desulfamplus sp.]|nr:4Fe-4S dicluster domain-containing protein [Desulfamplus sp.]
MKEVVVHPERCVGCMQCMLACATAHSHTLKLQTAVLETPQPKPRVHVGAGIFNEGFPNRCRHCDPAPCLSACLAGAIFLDHDTKTVMINPDRCINCASCAMACPYGVIRFHEDPFAPPGKTVAVKCDNCDARVAAGGIPACTETCKTGALTFEEISNAMKRKTREVACAMSAESRTSGIPPEISLVRSMKQACLNR